MKKFVFLCKLLLIACITKASFCSADVSLNKKELESQLIKIKRMAKRISVIQKLTENSSEKEDLFKDFDYMVIQKLTENSSEKEDPFKDFDYMSPNFYSCKSVK